MSNGTLMLQTLRDHRPLLLACEAIGWLHMTGKAHPHFLQAQAGTGVAFDDLHWLTTVSPPFPWDAKLAWLKNPGAVWHSALSLHLPNTLTDFITKHRSSDTGLLGLLQAAHGMASGIEKNVPGDTSRYLNQDATHLWLSSPFGHPQRNLLADPPPLLHPGGWDQLIRQIEALLDELHRLGSSNIADLAPWWQWREGAIGPQGWLRAAFRSTLAETRLPNNDVALWDQSYIAAALFKAAVAGAVLCGNSFTWDNQLKSQTRWRVLTIGFGAGHYEARAVRIGDWVGAQRDIERFFADVRRLIEVDLAVGALVYRDDETLAFTFPGERARGGGSLGQSDADSVLQAIEAEIDYLAGGYMFETPPLCRLSGSTRSFVPMIKELHEARGALAVPLHRHWTICSPQSTGAAGARHVCPVCQVRLNEPPHNASTDNVRKSYPCAVCRERRRGRLDAWLQGESDTIWISEVADDHDRVALLTLSLDIEPWLNGERIDSLRVQSIAAWRVFNPVLKSVSNPLDPAQPFDSLLRYVQSQLPSYNPNDAVLSSLQDGYKHSGGWRPFFESIVEDRADAPDWNSLNNAQRAAWLTHQLFRKLPSPGRVYRFWQAAESYFTDLLDRFRELAAAHPNRWRVGRLALIPDSASVAGWEDRETYAGRWRDAPFEVIYFDRLKQFVTNGNLARCLRPEETEDALKGVSIEVKGDDGQKHTLTIGDIKKPKGIGIYNPVILLDLNPQRFRALVPLNCATACIETAIVQWREQFGRVWDRLPLRIGVVAFPRMLPFQAVIEAARNLENALAREPCETWSVIERRVCGGIAALTLKRDDGQIETVMMPMTMPDGRDDVFYPYVRVQDRNLRYPHDFRHPNGQVYRHVANLCLGDRITVDASRVAAVFLDTTARRFEPVDVHYLTDFEHMQSVWDLLARCSPSLSALHSVRSELDRREQFWRTGEGEWLPDGAAEWQHLARAVLADRLGVSGAVLETLVDAAARGTFRWAIDWHLVWLKERLEGER